MHSVFLQNYSILPYICLKMDAMQWVFILGGSSGFGLATARLLAEKGYNIFIVHRDRRATLVEAEPFFDEIRSRGVKLQTMNVNIDYPKERENILKQLKDIVSNGDHIKLFLHSIAYGVLKPFISGQNQKDGETVPYVTEEDLQLTLHTMGTSFIWWSQVLQREKLFGSNARILGITSEGTQKVLPAYGAIAAAKAVMETSCKYLASELAPYRITTNLINAGITDTQALKVFPNYEQLIKTARELNPFKRLTQPEDIAKVISLLITEEASWINGAIIRVDGGEQIMSNFLLKNE
jgi:enoyl-[acyl-carrier protein] reductase III